MSARRIGFPSAPLAMVLIASASLAEAQEPASHGALPSPEQIARLGPDGGPDYNRLIFEKSPYLLQHATNPVDWHPWGEDAFEKARREDKPIFLSIGYSTCHWCHVMERESFSNDEVAALMNEHYIAIKVDREERPDIDQHYMTASIATRGSGGWPLTVFMTPEKKPFYIGTYFPLNSRPDRPGMLELLASLAEAWKNQRQGIEQSAERIVEQIRENAGDSPGGRIGPETLELAYRQIASRYDAGHGGIGLRQKFPYPSNLSFLLRYWRRTGEPRALEMVEKTLTEMRRGGIFDHIGFGFHRYATDRQWLVPHFEKMLYDQAMIAIAYIETYRATGRPEYADTARAIFSYLLRDMTSPEGAFYSAEDADSEGAEGKFYVWSTDEAREALGDEDAVFFFKVFNFEQEGNFLEQFTGHRPGTNIPHLRASSQEIARKLGMSEADLVRRIESCRERLFAVRERRVHPLKDDKVLTDWNGLAIAALAMGGLALDEPRYCAAAERAADFLWENLRDENGRLKKRYRSGEAAHEGRLADYAFFTWGLLELYEATFDVGALERALELNRIALDLFWDCEAGGFFMSAQGGEQLPVRTKETRDMAYPSGNSVAAMNLLRLGRMTADAELEQKARELLAAFSGGLAREPAGYAQMLAALDFSLGPANEVVIAGVPGAADTRAMARALGGIYAPNKVVLLRPSDEAAPAITRLAEFTLTQRSIEGRATAYVCTDYACRAPTTDPEEMVAQLAPSVRGARD